MSGYCFVGSLSWTVKPRTEGSSPLRVFGRIHARCPISCHPINILWISRGWTATRWAERTFGISGEDARKPPSKITSAHG